MSNFFLNLAAFKRFYNLFKNLLLQLFNWTDQPLNYRTSNKKRWRYYELLLVWGWSTSCWSRPCDPELFASLTRYIWHWSRNTSAWHSLSYSGTPLSTASYQTAGLLYSTKRSHFWRIFSRLGKEHSTFWPVSWTVESTIYQSTQSLFLGTIGSTEQSMAWHCSKE